MTDVMQSIGILLVPFIMISIGLLYLALAFWYEDYINKRGQEYFCKLHPNERAPYTASFWYYLKLEHERKERNLKTRMNTDKHFTILAIIREEYAIHGHKTKRSV